MKKFFATTVLIVPLCFMAPAADAAVQHPNFIVIVADDQGWGTTSVMMDPLVSESKSDFFKTPNIERLASAGMKFSQAYASHCNCSPSRAALLTGRSPAALNLTDIIERNAGPTYVGNKLIPPRHISALPAEEQTIPQLLKKAYPQYRTAHFGKWHLAAGGPAKFGFDQSDGPTGNAEGNDRSNLPDDPKRTFSIARKAIAFMQDQAKTGHPFYLQVSFYATHAVNQSRSATREKLQQRPAGKRHNNIAYGAMLEDLDEGIGQLMGAVSNAGLSDRTYIIYTADNGSIPTRDPGNINGPVRGYKATVWEGGIRVPFIVAGPGVKPGSLSRTPVVGYDILPTVCQLAGLKGWPETVEGGSMEPVLHGDGSAPVVRRRDFLVFHWPHYQHEKQSTPDTTLLSGGWKLHFWWETGAVQLFSLDKDLGESRDLAKEQRERAAAMKESLTNYLAAVRAQLPRPNPDYNPENDPTLRRKGKAGKNLQDEDAGE